MWVRQILMDCTNNRAFFTNLLTQDTNLSGTISSKKPRVANTSCLRPGLVWLLSVSSVDFLPFLSHQGLGLPLITMFAKKFIC